jgi:hypothetical protein
MTLTTITKGGQMKKGPEYKEDTTRGGSILNPRTYKGDVMVQVWLDSRMLATLDTWLVDNGVGTRFMSDVVRESLNTLLEYLIKVDDDIKMIDHTTAARDYLTCKFRVNLNPGLRGNKNVLHNKILSEGRKELIRPVGNRVEEISQPIERTSTIPNDEWDRIQKRIREEDMKDTRAQADKALEEVKFDENGVSVLEPNTQGQYTEEDRVKDEKVKAIVKAKELLKVVESTDAIRKKTDEELDELEVRQAKKDKEQADELNNMNEHLVKSKTV